MYEIEMYRCVKEIWGKYAAWGKMTKGSSVGCRATSQSISASETARGTDKISGERSCQPGVLLAPLQT